MYVYGVLKIIIYMMYIAVESLINYCTYKIIVIVTTVKPLYNELVGTSEIVHNMEVSYYRGSVNTVLGPATVSHRGFLMDDLNNREVPL